MDKNIPCGLRVKIFSAGVLQETTVTLQLKSEKYLNIFKDYPYIFNLGHGVLPEIKPEMIAYVVDLVRSNSK